MAGTSASQRSELFSTVVTGGYCIGCGACAATSAKIRMKWTPLGTYQATLDEALSPTEDRMAAAVCGFSARAQNEDQIAAALYSRHASKHAQLGYHAQISTGYVEEGTFRADGSSGGMGTWLAAELLRLGHVDAVLHVRPRPHAGPAESPLFEFSVARSIDDLRAGAHSHYYPVTLVDVLAQVKNNPGVRYALIAVPCFIKAARLLAQQDESIASSIRYHIGLVCGHLKSAAFAQVLGWQAGIAPESLERIDFRDKIEGRSPRKYGFRAWGLLQSGKVDVAHPMEGMFGGDWGLGFFKYKACDFCDDVFAETADITVGDAWLPQFDADWRGTNVLVVRHPLFSGILAAAAVESRIRLEAVAPDVAAASQRSGLTHRREGLSWRLLAADRRGEWRPPKRVVAGSISLTRQRIRIYEIREQLRDTSHTAFSQARALNDLRHFEEILRPLVKRYYDQFKPALPLRLWGRLKKLWLDGVRR